jgi:hypothetical protein
MANHQNLNGHRFLFGIRTHDLRARSVENPEHSKPRGHLDKASTLLWCVSSLRISKLCAPPYHYKRLDMIQHLSSVYPMGTV